MTSPVTVCIPTYNGQRYIRECLDSVVSQTFQNLEIIVVDDASVDETVSIVQEYAEHDRRIRLFINPSNLGLVRNWNRCIDLSSGAWIKFVLQDDLIEADCIAKMMELPPVDCPFRVCKRDFLFDGVEAETESLFMSYKRTWSMDNIFSGVTRISPQVFCQAARKCGTMNFIGEPTAVLIYRDVLKRVGYFNPSFVQLCDLDCWLRIGVKTGVYYIPEMLATFRVHSGSATLKGLSSAFFRTNIIDRLLLLHEFAYSPRFRQLRKGRCGYYMWRFRHQLAEAAYDARNTLSGRTSDSSRLESASVLEWNQVIRQFPFLEQSFYFYLIEARETLARYFWRFNRSN